MPLFMGNQLPQTNKMNTQLLLSQQKPISFQNGISSYGNPQPPEDLFDNAYEHSDRTNGAKLMKDVVNTHKKLTVPNNFLSKQQNGNSYQPTTSQNNNSAYSNMFQQAPSNFQRGQNGKENTIITEQTNFYNQNGNMMYNMSNANSNSTCHQYPAPPVVNQTSNYIETFKAQNEDDLIMLNEKHQELINVILGEEEEVISIHKQQIDDMVDCVKQVKNNIFL